MATEQGVAPAADPRRQAERGSTQAGGPDRDAASLHAGLTQLRAFIAQRDVQLGARLPPERELCDTLGVSRAELRKALAILESEGQLWRHVGKGTFFGERPSEAVDDLAGLAQRANPHEVMRARMLFEPMIAGEAAINATAADVDEMALCLSRSREAETWRHYETWDNRLHRALARATRNTLLVGMFDTLNAVRRAVVWGRLRATGPVPGTEHHSFAEHDRIVAAVRDRDADGASRGMRQHLQSVSAKLRDVGKG
jgi:DNA-binding FadR family transcriptional regulator